MQRHLSKQKRKYSSKQYIPVDNIERDILKKYPKFFDPLDQEEEELIDSIEKDEWVPVTNQKAEIKRYTSYFRDKQPKDKKLTIRLRKEDLEQIQSKAIKSGLPYQTLICAILHQYAMGKIKISL